MGLALPASLASDAPQREATTLAAAAVAAPAHRLLMSRNHVDGTPLHLRCVLSDSVTGEPVAVHDAEDPLLADLEPGRYRVTVFSDTLPFSFEVVIPPERASVQVQIQSAERAHGILTETREDLGQGRTLVERQILGIGWGPPPLPTQLSPEARERLARLRREAEAANAARRAEAERRARETARKLEEARAFDLGDASADDPALDLSGGPRPGRAPQGGSPAVAP
jgi:hypothetical protein